MTDATLFPKFDRENDIAENITQLIGQTPMVYLSSKTNDSEAKIALKLECANPMASVKDRLGLAMITLAERDGLITPGKSTLVEATSGNTGIALAQIGAMRGYKVILTMPETMSEERRCLLHIFGATVHLTPAALGVKGATALADKLVKETEGAYLTSQFTTQYNAIVHKLTTGPEIWQATKGNIAAFVAGVGTGGTVTGAGEYLKSQNKDVKVYAVEPTESAVISGNAPAPHKIMGIGAGFIPKVLNKEMLDGVLTVSSAEAMAMGSHLPKAEGIFGGISAGGVVHAAVQLGKKPEFKGKTIVVIIPSFGERYLSTAMFAGVRSEVQQWPTVPKEELGMA